MVLLWGWGYESMSKYICCLNPKVLSSALQNPYEHLVQWLRCLLFQQLLQRDVGVSHEN